MKSRETCGRGSMPPLLTFCRHPRLLVPLYRDPKGFEYPHILCLAQCLVNVACNCPFAEFSHVIIVFHTEFRQIFPRRAETGFCQSPWQPILLPQTPGNAPQLSCLCGNCHITACLKESITPKIKNSAYLSLNSLGEVDMYMSW